MNKKLIKKKDAKNKKFSIALFPGNKKGDIPVTVFIVGVVALCFLAIMSFVFVIFQINNTFYGINTMHKINLVIEEYSTYKNLGKTEIEIGNFLKNEISEYGNNYIYLEEKGASLGDVNKIVFSVKYYLP